MEGEFECEERSTFLSSRTYLLFALGLDAAEEQMRGVIVSELKAAVIRSISESRRGAALSDDHEVQISSLNNLSRHSMLDSHFILDCLRCSLDS